MLDKDFLVKTFEGIDIPEEKIEAVLAEHKASETGLIRNRDKLKEEKEILKKEFDDLKTEKETIEAKAKELNEKLESGLPDKEKQFFQAEVDRYKNLAEKTKAELDRQLAEKDTQIQFSQRELQSHLRNAALDGVLDGFDDLAPGARQSVRDLMCLRNEFEFADVAGLKQWLNKDSRSMKDVVSDFLNSGEGKIFRVATSSGGGANGSTSTRQSVVNPWKKETLNLTEQMRITKENPALAAQLETAAKT
jgi:hypothetical protein